MTKKTAPPASRGELQELAETLRHAISDFVRSVRAQVDGPTSAQSEVLLHLERAGPISVAALAQMRGVKHQSMRQIVGILEADGLVSRESDPNDGRSQLVVLTVPGKSVLKSARDARAQWLAEVLKTQLAETDLEILRAAIPILRKIADKKTTRE